MEPLSGLNIPRALQPLLAQATERTDTLLRLLRPGRVLRATVLDSPAPGLARLRLGGETLDARTPLPLSRGQTLLLQVARGLPSPLLRLLPTPRDASAPPPARQLQQHALARALPPQEVDELLPRLPGPRQTPLLRQVLEVLQPPAPRPESLDGATLREALRHSGLFLEPRLARQLAIPPEDRKLQLLQLMRMLQAPRGETTTPRPPTAQDAEAAPQAGQGEPAPLGERLLRLVEGSIARIQQHQAHSLPGDDPGRLAWRMDLPLQVGERRDHLELRIAQERTDAPEATGDALWKVEVRFDFQELGEVLCRISLQGDRVRCAFWSEQARTAERFERSLPRLRGVLEQAGLAVAAVSSLQGRPRNEPAAPPGLVDERA